MSTNTFDESKVRREQGKFAEKPHSEAEIDLGTAASSSPVDSADARARAAAKLDRIAPNWSEYIIRQNDDDGSFELGTVFDADGNDIDLNEDDAWEVTCDVSYIDSEDPELKSVDRDPYEGFRATVERESLNKINVPQQMTRERTQEIVTEALLEKKIPLHELESMNLEAVKRCNQEPYDPSATTVQMAILAAMRTKADREMARFHTPGDLLLRYDQINRDHGYVTEPFTADEAREGAAMRRLEEDLGLQTWQEDVLVDKIAKDHPGFDDLPAAEANKLWHEATMREAESRIESMGFGDRA